MTTATPDALASQPRALLGVTFSLLLMAYEACFGRFFPNAKGLLGQDYAYFLPELLAGDYWFHQNGPFEVPWFTPAFCGGRPLFGDPQSIYYSLAQWFSFVVDPLTAVHASLLVFAGLGFWGMWGLARRSFACPAPAALAAAAVFMFNGFYAIRMIAGHFAFHAFMLLPLLCWLLLREPEQGESGPARPWRRSPEDVSSALLAALVIGYAINAGMAVLLGVAVLTVCAVLLIALRRVGWTAWPGLAFRCLMAGGLGMALSSARLVASTALLARFPRDHYRLPGYDSLLDGLGVAARMLFLAPTDIVETSSAHFVNVQWAMGRHELEYGVTLVPLAAGGALLWHAARALANPSQRVVRQRSGILRRLCGLALALAILLPLAINIYDPDWNSVLKTLPLLASSSNLVRWFAVYIPLLALLTAFGIDSLPPAWQMRAGYLAAVAVVGLTALQDQSSFEREDYPPKRILAAAAALETTHHVPPVSTIGIYRARNGDFAVPLWRNDAFATGASQLACYYATFGYQLELMPVRDLQPGDVARLLPDAQGGHFNLKNPACYVYPAANACSPGDHFLASQRSELEAFVAYRPWPFAFSNPQRVANTLTAVALVSILLGLGIPWVLAGVRRTRRPVDLPGASASG